MTTDSAGGSGRMQGLPFNRIRVADFGWVIAAPVGTLWLATLGAEVIKIESKTHPDTLRTIDHGGYADGIAGSNRVGGFNSLNYSKYSCSLDLTKPRARELAKEIVGKSDIVVEAFTTPVAERFGLTYGELRAVKPDIILLSVSSLGRTGPLRDATGFGPANQAYAGLPSMADLYARQRHRRELDALVTAWTRERTSAEVTEQLQGAGISAGPSQSTLQLINDPQLQSRNQFVVLEHPQVGPRLTMGMPGVFGAIPERRYDPAPLFDRHNEYVFRGLLDMPAGEYEALARDGVIY